jgi:hypothetical protein
MVSRSYEVNECPTISDDNQKGVKNAKVSTASDHMNKIDRYILHISNEMVSVEAARRREEKLVRRTTTTTEERCVTRIIKDSVPQGHHRVCHNKKQFGAWL